MKRSEAKVAVVRIEGSNCEEETARAFGECGAQVELVHLKQFEGTVDHGRRRKLEDYHCLAVPGGFSAGDYVRAGAIFAARMRRFSRELDAFVQSGKPVLGICNGFQVLVELGLLPGFENRVLREPNAVLNLNDSARFECRPVHLRMVNRGKCAATSRYPRGALLNMPVAHAEGKYMAARQEDLDRLEENDQIVFSYSFPDGRPASPSDYPHNPNGAQRSIAALCNDAGNVFGIMPHPERVFAPEQHFDARRRRRDVGDGRAVFEGTLDYLSRIL
jgi:phosphoribosylformylglycinamidine synthase